MPGMEALYKALENPETVTLLAHVLGGMGENLSADKPMFSGVPQSLVTAQNYAALLNALGGGKVAGGKDVGSTTTVPSDNNPNKPADRMKISMDGTPTDLTKALTDMYFGGKQADSVTIPSWPSLTKDETAIPFGGGNVGQRKSVTTPGAGNQPSQLDELTRALGGQPPF